VIPAASRQAAFESTLGTLLPSSKTVLADADGVARITLTEPYNDRLHEDYGYDGLGHPPDRRGFREGPSDDNVASTIR